MAEVKRRRKTAVAGIAPNEPERDILDQYLYEVSTYPLLKGTEGPRTSSHAPPSICACAFFRITPSTPR